MEYSLSADLRLSVTVSHTMHRKVAQSAQFGTQAIYSQTVVYDSSRTYAGRTSIPHRLLFTKHGRT